MGYIRKEGSIMATLDEIFFKEFTQMMNQLRGINGVCNLNDIPLPPEASGFLIEKRKKVLIRGISEEYYSKLNEKEALLWGSSALRRRKFDYRGEFIKDKAGNYVLQDVPCPHDCVAIISPISIQVPNKFKSKEGFQYVDMITKITEDGKELYKFVYLVPRKYCYVVNQTALVLSWNKLRRFYTGSMLSLQNGSYLYLYIIPYKPTTQVKSYRILHCKTSVDYTNEITLLKDFWISKGIMFNPSWCQLDDYVRGRENMAYLGLSGTEDVYERFDMSRSMGEDDTFDDVEFPNE